MPRLRAMCGRCTIAAGLLLLSGCSRPDVSACTEIAAPSGVSVTVEKQIAVQTRSVILTICSGSDCQDYLVELLPGSDSVDQGCTGSAPHAACSATAVPNGTKVGFVAAELPKGKINISATVIRGGRRLKLDPIEVVTAVTYPNGSNCPPGGNQAKVIVGAQNLRG